MAYRKELCTAGLLLLLSLLQTNQSASIVAMNKMESLGKDALAHLVKTAGPALRNHGGPHSVGSITEPKGDECLNCTLICTFSSYLKAASDFDIQDKLRNKLKYIRQRVEDLRITNCSNNVTNTCEVVFQKDEKTYKNLEKLTEEPMRFIFVLRITFELQQEPMRFILVLRITFQLQQEPMRFILELQITFELPEEPMRLIFVLRITFELQQEPKRFICVLRITFQLQQELIRFILVLQITFELTEEPMRFIFVLRITFELPEEPMRLIFVLRITFELQQEPTMFILV
ncbi:hypothetical protein DPX16_8786 [Anabarilius grahami]|uniref:Uncharacterized protein n=1 Tax=Anabarilius grahami TaxID=495550 RepID=A0A3N0YE33_ANAGA|nr:hypothetical protein DPX16_8786 [Anabarilius grahami]